MPVKAVVAHIANACGSMKWSIAAACGLILLPVATIGAVEPSQPRQRELLHLVRQDCGSCHGMLLTGGLGLPLTPDALRDKPAEGLAATVLYGRPGTAMPPWQSILNEAEVQWIVRQLMTGFPTE
jgi:cytochrome c55X